MRKELTKLLVTGDWESFARDTLPYWRSLARHLRFRWDVPEAVEVEDVTQELLIGVMISVADYDPERGDAWAYVRWRSEHEARRFLNKQRRSSKYSDSAKSRYEVRCDDLELAKMLTESAIQERVVAAKESRMHALDGMRPQYKHIVDAWISSGGNRRAVAQLGSRRTLSRALAQVKEAVGGD